MKKVAKDPVITLQVNGFLEDCDILRITPKTVMLQYKDKVVYMSHQNFNFMLLHPEIDWKLTESNKDGNTLYFLV